MSATFDDYVKSVAKPAGLNIERLEAIRDKHQPEATRGRHEIGASEGREESEEAVTSIFRAGPVFVVLELLVGRVESGSRQPGKHQAHGTDVTRWSARNSHRGETA